MATCSSILAWKSSWPKEPGGRQSMGSQEGYYYFFYDLLTKQQQSFVELIHLSYLIRDKYTLILEKLDLIVYFSKMAFLFYPPQTAILSFSCICIL